MAYRDALEHGESNVGLGMVPCRKGCRCADCTIDTLRVQLAELEAERDRLREVLKDANSLCRLVVTYLTVSMIKSPPNGPFRHEKPPRELELSGGMAGSKFDGIGLCRR